MRFTTAIIVALAVVSVGVLADDIASAGHHGARPGQGIHTDTHTGTHKIHATHTSRGAHTKTHKGSHTGSHAAHSTHLSTMDAMNMKRAWEDLKSPHGGKAFPPKPQHWIRDEFAAKAADIKAKLGQHIDTSLEGYNLNILGRRSEPLEVDSDTEKLSSDDMTKHSGYYHDRLSQRDSLEAAAAAVKKVHGDNVDVSLEGYDHSKLMSRESIQAKEAGWDHPVDTSLEGYDHKVAAQYMREHRRRAAEAEPGVGSKVGGSLGGKWYEAAGHVLRDVLGRRNVA